MPSRFSFFAARFKALAAGALFAALALPDASGATERREQATFDLELRGIRAGSISFSGASNAAAYSVATRLQSTGLVNLVRRLRYEGQVQGRIVDGRLQPTRYQENLDNGGRESATRLEFNGRTPVVAARTPPREPRPYDIEPGEQTGAVDILTAVFAVFRDTPRASLCNLDLAMYDGRRRTQIVVSAPTDAGNRVTCTGEYRRVAGFSPEDMAERTRYPFTLVYGPGPEGLMRLNEVQMESTQGRGRLIRR